eukprot:scaffold28410_cov55-Phaeocystis_antarctica.AAC.7
MSCTTCEVSCGSAASLAAEVRICTKPLSESMPGADWHWSKRRSVRSSGGSPCSRRHIVSKAL